jgi:hypothetical protein
MRNLTYIHKVNGEVQDREKLLRWFNRYLDTCQNGDMLIEFVSAPRTQAQNAYYWVVVGIIARHLGITNDELHEYFKEIYLPKEEYFVIIKNKQKESTTTLNVDEMGAFLDNAIRFGAEHGVPIQDLEEYKHTH